jgi:hypothetical protein
MEVVWLVGSVHRTGHAVDDQVRAYRPQGSAVIENSAAAEINGRISF